MDNVDERGVNPARFLWVSGADLPHGSVRIGRDGGEMKDHLDLGLCLCIISMVVIADIFLIRYLEGRSYPYRARPLLTKREYKFYTLLREEAYKRGMLICPKIGLKDLMEVTDKKHYMKYFAKISQKHVDFVICDEDLQVYFALELDDSSHDTKKAKEKDHFKDRAF